ncbi:MAG: hypothetical protein QW353_07345 [Candidatus Korarchaeum sp.]
MPAWDTFVEFSETKTVEATVGEVKGGKLIYIALEATARTPQYETLIVEFEKRGKIVWDGTLAAGITVGPRPYRMEKMNVGPEVLSSGDIIRVRMAKGTPITGWLYLLVEGK